MHMTLTKESGKVIVNPEKFSGSYLPEDIIDREDQTTHLHFCLSSVLKKMKPVHAWMYGESSTGKSLVAKKVLQEIKRNHAVDAVYVNCWENRTFYSVINTIIDELQILGCELQDSHVKMQKLRQFLAGFSLIVILDDIDHQSSSERGQLLYKLCNLLKVSIVCISRNIDCYVELDDQIRSRLSPEFIHFDQYTSVQITQILEAMARDALNPESWDEKMLKQIAFMANGDARLGLYLLQKAAHHSETHHLPRLDLSSIRANISIISNQMSKVMLNELSGHHRLIYSIIRKKKEIRSQLLWSTYLQKCKYEGLVPVARRTFTLYCSTLRDLKLIHAERLRIKGRVYVYCLRKEGEKEEILWRL